MIDAFDRQFSYLRLSVTEACNFRCQYCLPQGYQRQEEEPYLSREEIGRLVRAFAGMGFWKVRVTGGEPTLRPDLLGILSDIAGTPGVKKLALSTNGFRLSTMAADLRLAGVTHLNVSVDSLDPRRFHAITGQDRLAEVLEGIETALRLGFSAVKVNAVLMKGLNDSELAVFLDWISDRPISVRFIELMQTGENRALFEARHLSASILQAQLLRQGWKRLSREEGAGPAVEFAHPRYRGRIGLIAPYSSDFCVTCNRLRISSRGALRLCLFGEGGYSLRSLLQEDAQVALLQSTVSHLLGQKGASHLLHEGRVGDMRNFSHIGG